MWREARPVAGEAEGANDPWQLSQLERAYQLRAARALCVQGARLVDPARFEGLDFERFFLQPMDSANQSANTAAAVAYCLSHPRWRLSVQTHKYLGLP